MDHSHTPLAALTLARLGPEDRVARHFRLYELSRSETADRQRIDNRLPDDETLRAAVHLARKVLDPIRDAFGPYTPASVYRCQALERALKSRPGSWLSTSPHTMGRACDVAIAGLPTLDLAHWASSHLPAYDQIICECHDPAQGPHSGWLHVTLLPPGAGRNRRLSLSYVVDPASGRLSYVSGLAAAVA